MSALVLAAQTWAPSECTDCTTFLTNSRKEEKLSSFEKRKKEATSQAFIVRSCWLFLHASVICSLFLIDSDLSLAWRHFHLPYLAAYLLLAVSNLALYANLCMSNPGYLQPGVHALSQATMKRDTEGSLAAEDAAELGIGRLAHIDIPLIGRRSIGWQRDRHMNSSEHLILDRTTTLPNLPSQFTAKEALQDVSSPGRSWDASPSASNSGTFEGILSSGGMRQSALDTAGAAINEAKTESAAGILAPGDRAYHSMSGELSPTTVHVNKVRVRGLSLGGDQDFRQPFQQASQDWVDREEDESRQPLLSNSEKHSEAACSTSDRLAEDLGSLRLERRPSKPLSHALSTSGRRRGRTMSWWEGPNPGRWCEYCGAWQLLRSRHCHDCGRCVRRFDHHCAWVGRCIGQDNHVMFWWYLVVQLFLLSWTTHVVVNGFRLPIPPTMGRVFTLLCCAVPTVLLTAFVAMLLGYHTYLVLTAQTTYELVIGQSDGFASSKVAYLQHLPKGVHPFSQGPAQNVIHFCCSRGGTTYQMPAALSARRSANL